jgi:threonine/homoserine/homoserine lactone efflux protein
MIDAAIFFKSLALGFAVSAPVGPVGIICMDRSLRHGKLTGLSAGMGATVADTFYGAIAAFGMASVTDFLLAHEMWFRLLGGIIVLALAWRTYFMPPPLFQNRQPGEKRPMARIFRETFFITLSNPMTVLAFMAVYAGLGIHAESKQDICLVLLGVFLGAGMWWTFLSLSTVFMRHRLSATVLGRFSRGAGIAIALFGAAAIVQATLRLQA